PAAFNEIVVYNANVLGVPEKGMEKVKVIEEAREKGVRTKIRYVDAIAKAAAAKIEREGEVELRVRMAKLLSDINLRLTEVGMRYITSKGGKIDVRGPVFIGVYSRLIS
ncbi:MAG: hypothetical protein QXO23_07625, partial [Candidatus Methanomethyliaceae archaeon]